MSNFLFTSPIRGVVRPGEGRLPSLRRPEDREVSH